jgi:homoserine kinase
MSKRVALKIPGSSANLGPGFDTLGLALAVYANVAFEMIDSPVAVSPRVVRKGEIAERLPADDSNLIYQTFVRCWKGEPRDLKSLQITVDSDIPLARGLGSSGTAILAAVWAARAMNGQEPDRSLVLNEAAAIEGHPDNLSASLFGGFVSSAQHGKRVVYNKLEWPEQWRTVIVIPSYQLETKTARAVLPKKYDKQDAVFNLQHLGLLITSVANRDEDALAIALSDKLHQPYREHLVPELVSLRKELAGAPVLGCVLSGAGPAILVIFNKRHERLILEQLEAWIPRNSPGCVLKNVDVDQQGLREVR